MVSPMHILAVPVLGASAEHIDQPNKGPVFESPWNRDLHYNCRDSLYLIRFPHDFTLIRGMPYCNKNSIKIHNKTQQTAAIKHCKDSKLSSLIIPSKSEQSRQQAINKPTFPPESHPSMSNSLTDLHSLSLQIKIFNITISTLKQPYSDLNRYS